MTAPAFRLPAEWEPQAGVLLAWPHGQTDWAERLDDVESTYVALVAAITRFEPVIVCVADAALRAHVTLLLDAADVDRRQVRFVRKIEYDDTWLRDSGPISLVGAGRFRLNDFRFTGWGGKFEASRDDCLIGGLFAHELFVHAEHLRIDWALEGGAIESDGNGSLLTTWRCLHQRHPEQSREQMSQMLRDKLGAARVLWLERGYLQGDDTDAHIDTLARFAPNETIVFQACDDSADAHFDELAAMRAELAEFRTQRGERYRLLALPWARPVLDDGRRLAASYANYLIVNGGVLVPAYGDMADAEAQRVDRERAPRTRKLVAVPCRPLIWQNGSLHCVSMQLPQGVLG